MVSFPEQRFEGLNALIQIQVLYGLNLARSKSASSQNNSATQLLRADPTKSYDFPRRSFVPHVCPSRHKFRWELVPFDGCSPVGLAREVELLRRESRVESFKELKRLGGC